MSKKFFSYNGIRLDIQSDHDPGSKTAIIIPHSKKPQSERLVHDGLLGDRTGKMILTKQLSFLKDFLLTRITSFSFMHPVCGGIAQSVEQRPEKPCVPSSSLGPATIIVSGCFRSRNSSMSKTPR